MNDPMSLINKIKVCLYEVIEENDLGYLNSDIDDILRVYTADLTSILLDFYPGATVMMHKFYRSCATLINGKVYNASGMISTNDYHIAIEEEINFIRKSFPQMSDFVMEKLSEKIYDKETMEKGVSLTLRRNNEKLS